MHGWWTASYVVLWLVVVLLALLVPALARQIGTLQLRLGPRGALEIDDEGPPIGEAVELLDLADEDGRPVAVGGPGAAQLLLFVSPTCPVCRDVAPSAAVAARSAGLAPIVISDADGADHHGTGLRTSAPFVVSSRAAASYAVPGTPYAVVLDELGVVRAKGTVNNIEQLEGLADTARRRILDVDVVH